MSLDGVPFVALSFVAVVMLYALEFCCHRWPLASSGFVVVVGWPPARASLMFFQTRVTGAIRITDGKADERAQCARR